MALAGGADRNFVVLSAASGAPDHVFGQYADAFRDLGVSNLVHVSTVTPEQAQDAAQAALVRAADDGIDDAVYSAAHVALLKTAAEDVARWAFTAAQWQTPYSEAMLALSAQLAAGWLRQQLRGQAD